MSPQEIAAVVHIMLIAQRNQIDATLLLLTKQHAQDPRNDEPEYFGSDENPSPEPA